MPDELRALVLKRVFNHWGSTLLDILESLGLKSGFSSKDIVMEVSNLVEEGALVRYTGPRGYKYYTSTIDPRREIPCHSGPGFSNSLGYKKPKKESNP